MGSLEVFECEDCGFEFEQDYLHFYLNLKTGQIEEFMLLMLTVGLDDNSPIKGYVLKTYCGHCNKYIYTYWLESLEEPYDMETAYLLTRLLLPRKLGYAKYRLRKYEKIDKRVKANQFEYLEDQYKHLKEYYEDLFEELKWGRNFRDIDVGRHIRDAENEVGRLENTVFSIKLDDGDYNFTMDGERLPKDICPNCKNKVYEIDYSNPCPKCGGKMRMTECADVD